MRQIEKKVLEILRVWLFVKNGEVEGKVRK